MSLAWGWFMRSAAASISSVVVSPLPHSFTMRRKGALVIPAMGAMRVRERISRAPIFITDPVYRRGPPSFPRRCGVALRVAPIGRPGEGDQLDRDVGLGRLERDGLERLV